MAESAIGMYRIVNIKRDEFDFRCDRKTRWGNPFPMKQEKDREKVIALYRSWLWKEIQNNNGIERLLLPIINRKKAQAEPLRLGCWCMPKACHCHVLARACEWYEMKMFQEEISSSHLFL